MPLSPLSPSAPLSHPDEMFQYTSRDPGPRPLHSPPDALATVALSDLTALLREAAPAVRVVVVGDPRAASHPLLLGLHCVFLTPPLVSTHLSLLFPGASGGASP
jgi:hypothetical protein